MANRRKSPAKTVPSGHGKVRDRAFGRAADEFGQEVAPLGRKAGAVASRVGASLIRALEPLVFGIEKSAAWIEKAVTERLKGIPETRIVEPDPRVAVPALQALTYSIEDEFVREMFANLIAADMVKETKSSAHPAFVEIIKEMSPIDAKVLKAIAYCIHYPVEFNARHGTEDMWVSIGYEYSFRPEGVTSDECQISLDNLERLGLATRKSDSVSTTPAKEKKPGFVSVEKMAKDVEESYREDFVNELGEADLAKLFGEGRTIFVRHLEVNFTRLGYLFLDICLPT